MTMRRAGLGPPVRSVRLIRNRGEGRDTALVDEPSQVPAPTSVDIDREHGMTLVWPDGHTSRFALPDLRANCPCAWCRSRREAGGAAWPAPPPGGERLRAAGAELGGT